MEFVAPIPFQEALSKLGRRSVITAPLSSAEWSDVPVQLRERAFFSAQVESGRFLQRGQNWINDFLAGNREVLPNGEVALKGGGRARFVELMREFAVSEGLGDLVPPDERGGLKDVTSQKRLELIFTTQVKQADEFGWRKQGMDPDVLDAYPAQRFIRVVDVKEPRAWHQQFEDKVFLKTSPIWKAINQDFGVPWGPWGWGCGHDVEDVDRDTAENEGLLQPGEAVTPPAGENFNDNLEASTAGIEPELIDKWKSAFGDQVAIDEDTMRWVPRTETPEPSRQNDNPVSAAILPQVYGALRTQMKIATEAIDSVHDDGVLPKLPLKEARTNDLGYLQPRQDASGQLRADYLAVRRDGPWPALTTVHEAGHLLSLEGIGAKGSLASASGELSAVLEAAKKTDAIQGLQGKLAATRSARTKRYLNYMLSDEEIWARAYAQYVAERSHSKPLKTQLAKALKAEKFKQWDTADFAPVAQAIDALFVKLGWL